MNRKILAVAWFEHSGHKIGIIIVQEIDDVKAGISKILNVSNQIKKLFV